MLSTGRSQPAAGWGLHGLLAAACVALAVTVGYLGVQEHRHSSQIADIQAALRVRWSAQPRRRYGCRRSPGASAEAAGQVNGVPCAGRRARQCSRQAPGLCGQHHALPSPAGQPGSAAAGCSRACSDPCRQLGRPRGSQSEQQQLPQHPAGADGGQPPRCAPLDAQHAGSSLPALLLHLAPPSAFAASCAALHA